MTPGHQGAFVGSTKEDLVQSPWKHSSGPTWAPAGPGRAVSLPHQDCPMSAHLCAWVRAAGPGWGHRSPRASFRISFLSQHYTVLGHRHEMKDIPPPFNSLSFPTCLGPAFNYIHNRDVMSKRTGLKKTRCKREGLQPINLHINMVYKYKYLLLKRTVTRASWQEQYAEDTYPRAPHLHHGLPCTNTTGEAGPPGGQGALLASPAPPHMSLQCVLPVRNLFLNKWQVKCKNFCIWTQQYVIIEQP